MNGRTIVAMGGGGFADDDPVLDRFVLERVDASRPRICFLPTASGDFPPYLLRFYEAFPARSFDTSVLRLFQRDVEDVDAFLGEQDVIYVGGGNTANLLDVWRRHGVDRALGAAWAAGVVLCGVSAGANCWFEASTTDSFRLGHADPLRDGLAFLPGSFSPHFDSEPERRPRYLELVATGELPDGVACDDFAAVRFEGTTLAEAVASRPGAAAYRVARGDAGVTDGPLDVRLLT